MNPSGSHVVFAFVSKLTNPYYESKYVVFRLERANRFKGKFIIAGDRCNGTVKSNAVKESNTMWSVRYNRVNSDSLLSEPSQWPIYIVTWTRNSLVGPIFFIFIRFLAKFGQIIGWRPLPPHVWEILDPPFPVALVFAWRLFTPCSIGKQLPLHDLVLPFLKHLSSSRGRRWHALVQGAA